MKRLFVLILLVGFCLVGKAQYYVNNPYNKYKSFNPSATSQTKEQPFSPQGVIQPKIFGLGGTVPVIDYKAIYQAVKTYTKLKEQYTKIKQKYELALKMARYIHNMPERYRVIFGKFRKIHNPDDFFNSVDGFMRAFNGEIQDNQNLMQKIDEIYKRETKNITKDDFSYIEDGDLIGEEQASIFKDFAREINLADNINKQTLSVIAQANSIQEDLEKKIQNLDNDSLSNAEDLNSEIAVLNKINATLIVLVKQQKQINSLLVSLLQQQLKDSILERDSFVQGQRWENAKIKNAQQEIDRYNRFFSLRISE